MFPDLAKQQERMNFPDLIEMRGWTILFRHADLVWSEVDNLWTSLADHLQTPYPLSDPRFIANPQSVADAAEAHQRVRTKKIENFRLTRFHQSLTHRNNMPIEWDITMDLGINEEHTSIVARNDLHQGMPFIKGTNILSKNASKYQHMLSKEQVYTAVLLNAMLHAPAAQFFKTAMLQDLGP